MMKIVLVIAACHFLATPIKYLHQHQIGFVIIEVVALKRITLTGVYFESVFNRVDQ